MRVCLCVLHQPHVWRKKKISISGKFILMSGYILTFVTVSHSSTGTVLRLSCAYFYSKCSHWILTWETNKFPEMFVVQLGRFQSHVSPALHHCWQRIHHGPGAALRTVCSQVTRPASTDYCVDSPCPSQHERSSSLPPSWPPSSVCYEAAQN